MSALSTIHKIFPTPTYMTLPSVGVDISDTSLKYVQFERIHTRDQSLALTAWGDIAIPQGVVERGNVHDQGVLQHALKEVKEKTRTEYISVSLPEERAYVFETTIPKETSRREMRAFIEFKLEENVPLSPRDAYFDFTIVGTDHVSGDYRAVVMVYALKTISNYYDACVAAELMPIAFEIEAQAIARASIACTDPDTYMIVDFGKTRMGIGIVQGGVLMYTSTIDISGEGLSSAMRQVLGDVEESTLTEIKNTKGITPVPGNEAIARTLREIVEVMSDELGIRMHYWHTRKADTHERQIKRVILCGGSANLWGLPEYLTDTLAVPVERAQVWQNAFSLDLVVPPITRKYSYGYATAIGLALRGF